MFTAVIERLSGKAALQEEIRIMKLALEQSTNGVAMLTKARNNLSERCEELSQQNTALAEQLVQEREHREQIAEGRLALATLPQIEAQRDSLRDQLALWQKRCTDLSEALERTRLLYNGQLEKVKQADLDKVRLQEQRDSLQDRCGVLQAQYDALLPSEEQQKFYDALADAYKVVSARLFAVQEQYSATMALLAELYEARIKKGSVKGWDMRYLDLKAQYDQLAPVEAVEAKETTNAE